MKNRNIINGKSLLLIVLVLFLSVASWGQNVSNFSGTWSFNESKSTSGDGGFRMVSRTMVINQEDNSFALDRTFAGRDGEERKMSEKYTLDGKESVNPIFNTSKKSKATWSADKKNLTVTSVIVFEMNGESNEIKSTEVYKLSDGGNTLTVDSQSTSSMGDRSTILVYDKK